MVENMDFSSSYIKLNEKYDNLQEFYNQLVDELPFSNETHNLNTLYDDFDRCDNLIHHVHGLYLIEKRFASMDTIVNEAIHKYHKQNILRLLSEHNHKD